MKAIRPNHRPKGFTRLGCVTPWCTDLLHQTFRRLTQERDGLINGLMDFHGTSLVPWDLISHCIWKGFEAWSCMEWYWIKTTKHCLLAKPSPSGQSWTPKDMSVPERLTSMDRDVDRLAIHSYLIKVAAGERKGTSSGNGNCEELEHFHPTHPIANHPPLPTAH